MKDQPPKDLEKFLDELCAVSKEYNATIKGIHALGFDVEVRPGKIIARFPDSNHIAFEGDFDQAQAWLLSPHDSEPSASPLAVVLCRGIYLERMRATVALFAFLSCVLFFPTMFLEKGFAFYALGAVGCFFLLFGLLNFARLLSFQRKIKNKN